MRPDQPDLVPAVRQALFHLSRGNPLPPDNLLLQSSLVSQHLRDSSAPDTTEERAAALHAILRQLVAEYALERPAGRRQQEVQQRTFDVLFALLGGQPAGAPVATVPTRSYERYHAAGIRMLAAKLRERQTQVPRDRAQADTQAVEAARQQANTSIAWLEGHPGCVEVFVLGELAEAAGIIADHDYYSEALPYFERLHDVLAAAPPNRIMRRSRATALRGLAHCLMNQNAIAGAIAAFTLLADVTHEVGDWEAWIHATHMLGVTHDLAGDWPAAAAHFTAALGAVRKGPAPDARTAWIQRDVIHALVKQGEFTDVPKLAAKSFAVREALGDAQGCMMTLEVWGRALIAQGKHSEARARLDRALAMAESVRSPLFHTILLTTNARLYVSWGKTAEGRHYAERAQTLALRHGLGRQLMILANLFHSLS